MNHHTYVRRNRRHWSLTQDELAHLLGLSQSAFSRCESGETAPDLYVALALQVIFSRSPRALFPGLYRQIEDAVMAVAGDFDRELQGKTDGSSLRKQQLLASMVVRSTDAAPEV
jgi:DNA-binding XRE family transcriptional regulator